MKQVNGLRFVWKGFVKLSTYVKYPSHGGQWALPFPTDLCKGMPSKPQSQDGEGVPGAESNKPSFKSCQNCWDLRHKPLNCIFFTSTTYAGSYQKRTRKHIAKSLWNTVIHFYHVFELLFFFFNFPSLKYSFQGIPWRECDFSICSLRIVSSFSCHWNLDSAWFLILPTTGHSFLHLVADNYQL